MALAACPSRSTLEALRDNALPVETAQVLHQHLETCPACRSILDSLRAPGVPGPSPAGICGDAPVGDYSFLDPAEQADEIGRLNQYRVLRPLGLGGMGIVFEAEDTRLQRRVALKFMRPDCNDASFQQRFLQEARVAASLPHDFIAAIYDVGEHKQTPYLAMEFLAGETLETRLRRDHWLPVTDALKIIRQVAAGLCEAHARGLIHRDIKPANIFLVASTTDARTGESSGQAPAAYQSPPSTHPSVKVKILDFGLARPIHGSPRLTDQGMILGTPHYLAPERITGGHLDGRTDLFSLGCVLFEMLTGKVPFQGPDTVTVVAAVLNAEPPSLADVAPHVSPAIRGLLGELLAKDPRARPANARLVVERIRAIEQGDTIMSLRPPAAPVSAATAPAPGKRRLGLGFWLGAATVLVALLIGLAALLVRYFLPEAAE